MVKVQCGRSASKLHCLSVETRYSIVVLARDLETWFTLMHVSETTGDDSRLLPNLAEGRQAFSTSIALYINQHIVNWLFFIV
ncbi:hypothetical protein V6N13_082858 [Hibiscus sabdariffa]